MSWVAALPVLLALGVGLWVVSLLRRDVSIVDVFWGPFFALATAVYWTDAPESGLRATLLAGAVFLWALRLGVHLGVRWWAKGEEDYRYAAMRATRGPAFAWLSLVTVFGFQALLAWVLSVPLWVATRSGGSPGIIGWVGLGLFAVGFLWEAVADAQLTRFKRDPANRSAVLSSGLWRYSRHPNYFGEAVLWWGFFLVAADANGWWTVFAPITMTLLLLRVSGVPLLEPHLRERRPGYGDYVRKTPAFFPWSPRP